MADAALSFGPFRVIRSTRSVLEAGNELRLGGRAFDILLALIDHAGEAVTNDDLLAIAWPDTAVDAANLRVQVRALRRALGDGNAGARYIVNVPLRGYCFVAPITRDDEGSPAENTKSSESEPASALDLPLPLSRLVGRSATVTALATQVRTQRLVSIVGPAGVGKSAVALSVAEQVASAYAHGVRFIDLAPLSDPKLVPGAIASALHISLSTSEQIPAFVRSLTERELIVVLDNCEHLVDAVASLVETVLRGTSRVSILTTSREALRVPSEWVSHLPSLGFPPASPILSAADALAFPAVELFVERASASLEGFVLTDAHALTVAELCRKLDGNPLAIELAAARVDSSNLTELARHLDDRFRLLTMGRRTALPRQQTLRGAMDWSYDTLSPPQKRALRLLSTFPGAFDVDGAAALAVDDEDATSDALSEITGLVEKSLVTPDFRGEKVQYHLLAMTRAYAFEKLIEHGEHEQARQRHALYTRQVLGQLEATWERVDLTRWCTEHAGIIDDIRFVIAWALSAHGDAELGVAIAAASSRCAALLCLHGEFRNYTAQALEVPGLAAADPRTAARLMVALSGFDLYARGKIDPSIEAAHALAEAHGGREEQEITLEGLWSHKAFDLCEYRDALELARRHVLLTSASTDLAMRFNSERILGLTLHFLGDQGGAQPILERVAAHAPPLLRADKPLNIDLRVSASIGLARSLWLQGSPAGAKALASETFERACALDHQLSICYVLAFASCPIAIWSGDFDEAEQLTQSLRTRAQRNSLQYWETWADLYELALSGRESDNVNGLPLMQQEMLTTMRPRLTSATLRAHVESDSDRWCASEVLRGSAEDLLRHGKHRPEAERLLLRSLDIARRQHALAWELRAATSLARLRQAHRRDSAHVRELLEPVMQRFVEGSATADLTAARDLLEAPHVRS
ncbi:MAG TPA: winged helix-turn-helix domain-containing protein [Polyangiaceae bacterium]|nr:winged helix-turn-helix domain-containing protein [Polyangiaceae bacterium]